jgi:hypothetical protein
MTLSPAAAAAHAAEFVVERRFERGARGAAKSCRLERRWTRTRKSTPWSSF